MFKKKIFFNYIFNKDGNIIYKYITNDFSEKIDNWPNIFLGKFSLDKMLKNFNIFLLNDQNINFYFFSNINNIGEIGNKMFNIIKKNGDKNIKKYILTHDSNDYVKMIKDEYSKIFSNTLFLNKYLIIFKLNNKAYVRINFKRGFILNSVKVNNFEILTKINNNLIKNRFSKDISLCIKGKGTFNCLSIM